MRTFALFVALLAGCAESQAASTPADWVPVTASCGYTFMAPPDLVAKEVVGIDSCVDQWSTDACTLAGDLGVYSSPDIETPGLLDFWESSETIDGRMAQLSTARNQLVSAASQFQSSVHFAVVDSNRPDVQLKVSAYCPREAARDETLLLFRSIRFPDDLVN
jgi:hypothetical protein